MLKSLIGVALLIQINLGGTGWQLATINAAPTPPGNTVTLMFGVNGRLTGFGGCHAYHGSYTTSGSALTLSAGFATCPQEEAYFAALAAVASFALEDGQLVLRAADGTILLTFTAAPAIVGMAWRALDYDAPLTAIFGVDGRLTGSVGRTAYAARYEVDGHALAITGRDLPADLASTASYGFEDKILTLYTASGVPVARFVAIAPADTFAALHNATYHLVCSGSTWTPGADTSRLTDLIAAGELQGQPVTAVVIESAHLFYDLAVMDADFDNVATACLGDDMSVQFLGIDEDRITVISMMLDKPMCCGRELIAQTYTLRAGALVRD